MVYPGPPAVAVTEGSESSVQVIIMPSAVTSGTAMQDEVPRMESITNFHLSSGESSEDRIHLKLPPIIEENLG